LFFLFLSTGLSLLIYGKLSINQGRAIGYRTEKLFLMDNLIRYEHKKSPLPLMHYCYRICYFVVTENAVFFVTVNNASDFYS